MTAKKPSLASRIKELLLAGVLTNRELLMVLEQEYDLPAKRRRYVGWYRCQLRRQGRLPKATLTSTKTHQPDQETPDATP